MDEKTKESLSSIGITAKLDINSPSMQALQSALKQDKEIMSVIKETTSGFHEEYFEIVKPLVDMQKEITNSVDISGITSSIRSFIEVFNEYQSFQLEPLLKSCQSCLKTLTSATKVINDMEKKKFDFDKFDSYKDVLTVSNKVYHFYSSKGNKEINTDYILDSINEINNKSNDGEIIIEPSTIEFVEQNKETIQEIINCYNKNSINEYALEKNKKKKPDWKFIIGSIIIPFIIALIGIYQSKNDNKIEINNYYGNNTNPQEETSIDLTQEDIKKLSEILEKMQNQDEQSEGINQQTNP